MKTNHVGTLAKGARLQAGLSQWAVAKKLGYTTAQYISNYERGLAPMSPKIAKKFCAITGLSIHVMFAAMVKDAETKLRKQLFNNRTPKGD